ncbi:MAG TPA: hypothetical protein PKY56_08290 [Candidatus Kapabacteria bacterium]|nr:hypothetical protein [Candidatus Kapabacteria bacterium]
MELKGILDFSLGNFLTLRGYALLGDLEKISEPDESFQRDLINTHKQEIVDFLSNRKFLFFPEVILGSELSETTELMEDIQKLFGDAKLGNNFNYKFKNFSIKCSTTKSKSKTDSRIEDYFRRVTITISNKLLEESRPFSRIDGNHRISATHEKSEFNNINTPFSIILFRNQKEKSEYSKVIFHNINAKSIPIGLEHSTKLILEDIDNYSNDMLKDNPSFGWEYYLARRIFRNLDFELLPHIHNSFKNPNNEAEYASRLLTSFKFLLDEKCLNENENSIKRFKTALSDINGLYGKDKLLENSFSIGLLGSFLYFQLKPDQSLLAAFNSWVISNHISQINEICSKSFIEIFEKIIESRNRKIFVSMPFGKTKTDNHFNIISRICNEINDEYKLKVKLKAERVDWFEDGTSYEINDKILSMIADSGYLIGDLTYARPNVYHEIGFIMGKDKALGKHSNNFLLLLNESVDTADKKVGFNLQGIKQIRFSESEELAPKLKENLVKFYKLQKITA